MARRQRQKSQPSPEETTRVWVCRGGDCGSRRKHPEVDHRAQLDRFKGELEQIPVTVTACLDACEHSNVVVVRTPDEEVWLGGVNDEESTEQVIGWVAAGTDDPPPGLIEWHAFRPTRRMRSELPD